MKIRIILFLLLLPSGTFSQANHSWTLPTPSGKGNSMMLIPYPAHVSDSKKTLRVSRVSIDQSSLSAIQDNDWISAEFMDICQSKGIGQTSAHKATRIIFRQIPSTTPNLSEEGYTLSVTPKNITVSASGYGGFFNALQTLRQLISKTDSGHPTLPICEIADNPAFPVRGIMLDVGRNYISIPSIKQMVRKLSYYKINLLHLHLTDDPGWRLEIKKHPELIDSAAFWKTRQPGKYYTQEEIRSLIDYCDSLHVEVVPEIDMPGHSAAFTKATGVNMQSEKGIAILKDVLDETSALFRSPLFHIGSDEVHIRLKSFIPEMNDYLRAKGKQVITWFPGATPDTNAILMCWGENENGFTLNKSQKYIDCNGFYLDWMDSQSGVYQVFFQQPCETPQSNGKALGSVMAAWADGALSGEKRIIEQYPFYPCALTFAERIWRGSREKRKDLMAQLPPAGTKEWKAFAEFEDRLVYHRDHYFPAAPFAYVKQAGIKWKLIGPFDHKGNNDTSFEPEKVIQEEYATADTVLKWNDTIAYGGAIHIRHLYAMFNMHQNKYRPDHWRTVMSSSVGIKDGTCYALSYIYSPKGQDIYLMIGINGMWGHSGGYRTAPAPGQGSWDFSGGDIWLNDRRIAPPAWHFKSLPWGGWGKGRIEEAPLTEEGYFFRPPVKVRLKKGVNKILVKSVFGHWKNDTGERKWFFCCIPVNWDGLHYTEAKGLKYSVNPEIFRESAR